MPLHLRDLHDAGEYCLLLTGSVVGTIYKREVKSIHLLNVTLA